MKNLDLNTVYLSEEGTELSTLLQTTEQETEEVTEADNRLNFQWNVDGMLDTLPMMGKGMLGIFLVTLLIVASVAILNKATNRPTKNN